ncbi:unnamed protein product [Gemmata massiliana]|uniref:Uncharacterized protein n=1 Tax=Gemmata massiliana TaxID=1210884 RepID=A0A6P2D0U3_9BACT|nr:unnamed protein product [Gemmata massiliana]
MTTTYCKSSKELRPNKMRTPWGRGYPNTELGNWLIKITEWARRTAEVLDKSTDAMGGGGGPRVHSRTRSQRPARPRGQSIVWQIF